MNAWHRPHSLVPSVLAAMLVAAGAAFAQPAPSARPGLEPLPDVGGDIELEPQVTITRRQGETVEEARVNGRLVWIKVTPAHGRPYFLIPDGGEQTFLRRESLDPGLKVPLWVLLEF